MNVEAERFINRLRNETAMFRSPQHFHSVHFLTTTVPDAKDVNKTVVMYEAYILYFEE